MTLSTYILYGSQNVIKLNQSTYMQSSTDLCATDLWQLLSHAGAESEPNISPSGG